MSGMSVLRLGDEGFHLEDGSHNWVAPDDEQEIYEASLRAHIARHRGGESGQARRSPRDGLEPRPEAVRRSRPGR